MMTLREYHDRLDRGARVSDAASGLLIDSFREAFFGNPKANVWTPGFNASAYTPLIDVVNDDFAAAGVGPESLATVLRICARAVKAGDKEATEWLAQTIGRHVAFHFEQACEACEGDDR